MTRAMLLHVGLAATAYSALLLSGAAPAWVPALGFLGLFLRLALGRRRLPGMAVKLLLLVLVVAFLWRSLILVEAPADLVKSILVFLGPLLLLHILAARTLFDDFTIVLASLLVFVLGVSVLDGLAPLFLTVTYLVIACLGLPAATRRRARGAARLRRVDGARGWVSARSWAAGLLACGGLLLGCALYLAVPRLSAGAAVGESASAAGLAERRRRRLGAAGRAPVSGFPAQLRLGDVGRIQQSRAVAFLATLGLEGHPHDPEPQDRSLLLLRARVWETYVPDRRRWVRRKRALLALPAGGRIEAGPAPLEWSMSLRGYDGHTLFLPQRARTVQSPAGSLRIDAGGVVSSSHPVRHYAVTSALPPTRPEHLLDLRPDPSDPALLEVPAQVRSGIPRLLAPGATIADAVARVRRVFEQERFRYTLDLPRLPPGRDPIVAFLDRREGHCELFASAACLLLRRMGIPARLAGGVRLSERIAPGVYRARYSNAHAWVEIACEQVGFVAVDFTPPDEQARSLVGPAAADAEPAAADEPEAAGEASPAPLDWSNPFRYGRLEQRRLARWVGRTLGFLPWLLVALGLAAGPTLLAVVRRRRRRRPLRVSARPGVPRRALAFYGRWLRACAARGHRRAPTQTPREFLEGLPAELRAEGAPLTAAFERLRYG